MGVEVGRMEPALKPNSFPFGSEYFSSDSSVVRFFLVPPTDSWQTLVVEREEQCTLPCSWNWAVFLGP